MTLLCLAGGRRCARVCALLLIGCGLRRAQLTTFTELKVLEPQGHWVIADLRGKGGHIRTIRRCHHR